MKKMPNKITAHNAGWRNQVRFAGSVSWSGVCEFYRWRLLYGELLCEQMAQI